jgi:hypothetical protein
MPTSMKSAPVERPWFTIWRIEPSSPSSLSAKIPSITKPRCATDEYATSFFTSACTIATSAPYRIPASASPKIGGANRTKP